MKIGVLTYFNVPNFGANIQALCTNAYLTSLGHDVWFYNYLDSDLENKYKKSTKLSQYNAHMACAASHLQLTAICRNEQDLLDETSRLNIDHVIVGSDAVFNLGPGHAGFPNPFWLNWCKDSNIPYSAMSASSMGYFFFKEKARLPAIRASMRGFDNLSVRDLWTYFFVLILSSRIPSLSFDPTCMIELLDPLLVNLDLPKELKNKPYVVTTFSENYCHAEWMTQFRAEANSKGYMVCALPHPDKPFLKYSADYTFEDRLDPLIWLNIIKHSSGYLGERFHPMLISTYYAKPAVSIDAYAVKSAVKVSALKFRSKSYDALFRGKLTKLHFQADTYQYMLSPNRAVQIIMDFDPAPAMKFKKVSSKRFKEFLCGVCQ